MFDGLFRRKVREEEIPILETAYTNMTERELSKEITSLENATNWTPEQLAALDPETRAYVQETITGIHQQQWIARDLLRKKR